MGCSFNPGAVRWIYLLQIDISMQHAVSSHDTIPFLGPGWFVPFLPFFSLCCCYCSASTAYAVYRTYGFVPITAFPPPFPFIYEACRPRTLLSVLFFCFSPSFGKGRSEASQPAHGLAPDLLAAARSHGLHPGSSPSVDRWKPRQLHAHCNVPRGSAEQSDDAHLPRTTQDLPTYLSCSRVRTVGCRVLLSFANSMYSVCMPCMRNHGHDLP